MSLWARQLRTLASRGGGLRRLSSAAGERGGGRKYVPQHQGYGHDILGDRAGFQPVESAALRDIDGLVNHGPTCVDSFSSTGFVVNGISLPGAVLLLPDQSFLFAAPSIQVRR